MTLHRILLVAVVLLGLFTQPALAQRFGSRSNSLVSLAGNEVVQKEISVTPEVAARLEALNDESRNASQKEFTAMGIDYSALSDLPALERAAEMRKVSEKTALVNRKLAAQFLPKLQEILSPDQIARLRQIQLQASGIEVWIEPEVSKELELSEEQRHTLTELRNEYNRRAQQLDGDFQQRFAKIREMNAERDKLALDLLNAAQQDKLNVLKGASFDVSQLGFRRRGNN